MTDFSKGLELKEMKFRDLKPLKTEITTDDFDDFHVDDGFVPSDDPATSTDPLKTPSRKCRFKSKKSKTSKILAPTLVSPNAPSPPLEPLHPILSCSSKIGNCYVLMPRRYHATNYCPSVIKDEKESDASLWRWRGPVLGPHMCGFAFTNILLHVASFFVTRSSLRTGPVFGGLSIAFWTTAAVMLLAVGTNDPGFVTPGTEYTEEDGPVRPEEEEGDDDDAEFGLVSGGAKRRSQGRKSLGTGRWCDFCNTNQPKGAQHCLDCGLCVEGYDHHCPWMGTCVGKNNFKYFTIFNLTWVVYFFFAMVFVVTGPSFQNSKRASLHTYGVVKGFNGTKAHHRIHVSEGGAHLGF
uniref:Palmitoyltransferase n=1 Tax=Corethron hystrix TaxID=216773 RepID=A0A7S1BLT0_9STRA|mmetsp:Transcript_33522/g.77316  ORF Transcript_33522/g.77316 Transcript_33522/m.77316 type:complete len:351 (+) Transcript_33522:304-1356(+)